MPMRICAGCHAGENPLGKLKVAKYMDGEIYCENCTPGMVGDPSSPASPVSPYETSAGRLVVIICPECRGLKPGRHGTTCSGCAGYGSVRIPENNLVVYRPRVESTDPPPPTVLMEDGELKVVD